MARVSGILSDANTRVLAEELEGTDAEDVVMSKQDRIHAEHAAEWFARKCLDCVHTRRAIRTRFQKVDLFGADVAGIRQDGTKVWIQSTATKDGSAGTNSGNVWARKKKLEAIAWGPTDTVLMVEMCRDKVSRGFRYFFRVQQYDAERLVWVLPEVHTFSIPREWFKAWKPEEKAA